MDFLLLTQRRYSLRRYSASPVSDSVIDRCLEAARNAPSACNSQPWSFVVVRTPERVADLARVAFGGVYSMNAFAAKAPVIIVVATERAGYAASVGGMLRGTRFSLMDVGIACEHIALQAAELGLGSCMFGWFNERGVKRALSLGRSQKVDILMALGYPEEGAPVPVKKRRTLDEIRRFA